MYIILLRKQQHLIFQQTLQVHFLEKHLIILRLKKSQQKSWVRYKVQKSTNRKKKHKKMVNVTGQK